MNKIRLWVIIIVIGIIVFSCASGSGSSGSSSKPWKELGVSEREYKEVYNYYKYGN